MSFKFKPATAAAAFVCTAGLLATAVHAQEEASGAEEEGETPVRSSVETLAEARTSLVHSDNMSRTDAGKQGDTMASAGIALDVHRTTQTLTLAALADLDWVEFLDNTYDGQALGYLDASGKWSTRNERFQWMAQETFGQAQTNAFASATPDNLQNVNNFTTGPDVNLRFGETNTLSLFGRYSKASYETANFDSSEVLGGVSLEHKIGIASSVGITAETESTKFDDVAAADFDTDRAFLSYETQGARTGLHSRLGYTKLRGPTSDSSAALVDVSADRRVGAYSTFFVTLRQQFLSSADALRLDIEDPTGPGTSIPFTTADAFKDRLAEAGVMLNGARTRLSISVSHGQEQYDQRSVLDRTRSGAQVTFRRRLRPTLSLGVTGRYLREKFDNVAAKYDETAFSAELSQTFGRHLGMAISVERYDRSGSQLFSNYVENRAGVSLTYSFAGAQ